ncbi:MAG: DNA topoisomerase IV subunit B [Bdellovibrionales bacterium]
MKDLFAATSVKKSAPTEKGAVKADKSSYSAADIEVLEGLEPVRRRPGMYIGGTDERALHHLVAEVLDNAMDEAVAGHASKITINLDAEGYVTITDNGRGIPIDPHPKYPKQSALEVILTMLHSGGKFSGKLYNTAGGLHGVGVSVVNALSDPLYVEVARDKQLYGQTYSKGTPQEKLKKLGPTARRGTSVKFKPDLTIFGKDAHFKPAGIYKMAKAKAFLQRGVTIDWSCPQQLVEGTDTPAKATLHFPGGLRDYLQHNLGARPLLTATVFAGLADLPGGAGKVEWAIGWPADYDEGFCHSYVNTIPTPQGGTHEQGLRSALMRSLRNFADLVNNKKISVVTVDDVWDGACILLSTFVRDPQFQGQTKDRLTNVDVTRQVDNVIKDHFDHWLTSDKASATRLLDMLISRAEERQRHNDAREQSRKSATKKLRLPGKLADCSRQSAKGTEIFLVEGDSAGGSAKQARNRETQAILPLRGKILNVASASADKLRENQELSDLVLALGCGRGKDFNRDKLRYERVIIMTDADVDGAHIAALLMTFFYREMPALITGGHLFLAQPPLYRLSHGSTSVYARDDAHRDELLKTTFKGKTTVETSRFKGLGEMMPAQLRETTMDVTKRSLLKVQVPNPHDPEAADLAKETAELVDALMGKRPEARFQFIQENAAFAAENVDV